MTPVETKPVVALVCDTIYPYSHGGRELRLKELLPRLADQFDLHVYTMHWWEGPPVYTEAGVTYHAISPLLPLYTQRRRSNRQALRFGLACLRLFRCTFDVLDADHIPNSQVFTLRLVATLKRRHFIVTWHEVWSRSYWLAYLGRAGWIASVIDSITMRLPDEIVAASPETARRLHELIGKDALITAVPNGINLDAIAQAPPASSGSDLVTVGRLIDHKRIDMLLDVLAELRARGIEVTCRVIGDGPARVALLERASSLGVSSSVDFRHDVAEQDELYSLIKAAKLFVSLSEREGFGMAVLEAIGCGVPVLTTSAPDNLAQQLVARYSRGMVCEPRIDDVTTAVQKMLMEADDVVDRVGTDPWVADYDWGAIADRMRDVYIR
jgi:glycosyltransferase involved in cell wall biosynthesis